MVETVLRANLAREIARRGTNASKLARDAGLKPDAVRDIIRGRKLQPGAGQLDAIARVLGLTPAQLLGSEPVRKDVPALVTEPSGKPTQGQVELDALRLFGELSARDKRIVLRMIEAMLLDD